MSNHTELSVYRATYSLLEEIAKGVRNMNRSFKFSLGEMMLVNGVSAVSEIASANRTKSVTERIYHIEKLINLIENNMVQVRLARDLRVIQDSTYSNIVEIASDCLEQSKKWKRYTERNASTSQK